MAMQSKTLQIDDSKFKLLRRPRLQKNENIEKYSKKPAFLPPLKHSLSISSNLPCDDGIYTTSTEKLPKKVYYERSRTSLTSPLAVQSSGLSEEYSYKGRAAMQRRELHDKYYWKTLNVRLKSDILCSMSKSDAEVKTISPHMSLQTPAASRSPDVNVNVSFQLDGLQSPVPTMQSEYDGHLRAKYPGGSRSADSFIPRSPRFPELSGQISKVLSGRELELERKSVIVPFKPLGPDPLPGRRAKKPLEVHRIMTVIDDECYVPPPPEFTLDDFIQKVSVLAPISKAISAPIPNTKSTPSPKAFLSKQNFNKLSRMLEIMSRYYGRDMYERPPPYRPELHIINIGEGLRTYQPRVPKHHTLLEMKLEIKQRLDDLGFTSPSNFEETDRLNAVLSEVDVLAEQKGVGIRSRMDVFTQAAESTFHQLVHAGSLSTDDSTDPADMISPAELAILNCLMDGGHVLNLKAHFIADVPDLSPLHQTLMYLNLSFNHFASLPRDVGMCKDLQVLKLRDNPLTQLPDDIGRLYNLRTLVVSFCCLPCLPHAICSLAMLEFLDVSYNLLTSLPNEMHKLKSLKFLNVEGNELVGLPCGLLRVELSRVRIVNNLMHSLFWPQHSLITPQPLADLCLTAIERRHVRADPENCLKFPPRVAELLSNHMPCDCCRRAMYGRGLRIIRPCSEIWGMRRVPFIFHACSPRCHADFLKNTDPKVTEWLYGVTVAAA